MATVTICSDFGAQENSLTLFLLFLHLLAMKWWDWMTWSICLILSFKPAFSLFSFTLIKRFFSSSSLSAIRMISSAYLRLLIFLPAILIPACNSFSPAFHMMCSAGSHHGRSHPWQKSCGRELLSKASELNGLPRLSRTSTPKPESVLLFHDFHQFLWH